MQLYGHVVTVRHPFKLPIGSVFGHLATWVFVEPLRCDACRVVILWIGHSVALPFLSIQSIRNTSVVVWSCGYCVTAIQVAQRFSFWPLCHMVSFVEPLRCDAS